MIEVLIFFVFAVIIGILFTFFGYPFFRFLLPLWGLYAGISFGFRGLESMLGPGIISPSLSLIIGLLMGLLLAAFAYYAYAFAVYLFGVSFGYVLGTGSMLVLGFGAGQVPFLVGVAGAVLCAFLFAATRMPRLFIIFLSAAAGALTVVSGLFVLFEAVPVLATGLELSREGAVSSIFWLAAWAVLAGFGIAFQYAVASMGEDVNRTYNWEKQYVSAEKLTKRA